MAYEEEGKTINSSFDVRSAGMSERVAECSGGKKNVKQ